VSDRYKPVVCWYGCVEALHALDGTRHVGTEAFLRAPYVAHGWKFPAAGDYAALFPDEVDPARDARGSLV